MEGKRCCVPNKADYGCFYGVTKCLLNGGTCVEGSTVGYSLSCGVKDEYIHSVVRL